MPQPPERPPSEVPTVPPTDSVPACPSLTRLLTQLRQDQRLRWRRGERPRVEDYLERHPQLRADPDAVLDLAYAEFVLREELGEVPTEEEYLARFPQQAGGLRAQFDLHRWMQGAAPGDRLEAARVAPVASSPQAPTVPPSEPSDAGVIRPGRAPGESGRSGDRRCVSVPGYEVLGALGEGAWASSTRPARRRWAGWWP
jgi:hypothetical protein